MSEPPPPPTPTNMSLSRPGSLFLDLQWGVSAPALSHTLTHSRRQVPNDLPASSRAAALRLSICYLATVQFKCRFAGAQTLPLGGFSMAKFWAGAGCLAAKTPGCSRPPGRSRLRACADPSTEIAALGPVPCPLG